MPRPPFPSTSRFGSRREYRRAVLAWDRSSFRSEECAHGWHAWVGEDEGPCPGLVHPVASGLARPEACRCPCHLASAEALD